MLYADYQAVTYVRRRHRVLHFLTRERDRDLSHLALTQPIGVSGPSLLHRIEYQRHRRSIARRAECARVRSSAGMIRAGGERVNGRPHQTMERPIPLLHNAL